MVINIGSTFKLSDAHIFREAEITISDELILILLVLNDSWTWKSEDEMHHRLWIEYQ